MTIYGMKRILLAGLAASALCMGSVHAEQPIQQIPSLLVSYTSVRDAWAVAGLPVYTPTLLPVGYAQKDIIVIDRSIAEIFYRNDAGKEILFRMAKTALSTRSIRLCRSAASTSVSRARRSSSGSPFGRAAAILSPSRLRSLSPLKQYRLSSAHFLGTDPYSTKREIPFVIPNVN